MPIPPSDSTSLTVVVAAWNSPAHLEMCLASLLRERANVPFGIVACHPAGRGFEETVAAAGGQVAGLALPGAPTVPQLRKAGLTTVAGGVVAFLEDHAQVDLGWAQALLEPYARPEVAAVGGPVRAGSGLGSVDWAAYVFDYGRFIPPMAAQATKELSGINMSFRRSVLDAADSVLSDGVYEGALLGWLNAGRNEMRLAPGATVTQYRHDSLRGVLASVFHLGRGYAARRVGGAGPAVRAVRAMSSVALPLVLALRRGSSARRAPRDSAVGRSLVYLFLILLSWSAGECAGYVAGAGDSDAHWR